MFENSCSAGFSRRMWLSCAIIGSSGPSSERALDLVLLGVQVLLRALADGDVLEVLEARVDPVARAERRGQHEPRLERRPAAVLEVGVQDVGRVGEEVRAEVLLLAGVGELRDVLGQLLARVLPGEVGVGLAEADLAEVAHHRALGERLGEEHDVAVAGVDLARSATPRTRTAWCAGCRRGTPSRRSRPSAASRRAAPPRARASPATPS